MTKLIASDLDGTLLLNGTHSLNPEVYDLILALQKKGISFVAASGRQLESLRNLFKPIADQINYVAENGALYAYNNQIIVNTEIERALAFRIIESIQTRKNCDIAVSGVNSCYVLPGNPEFLYHVQHELNNKTTIIDNFKEIDEPILKIATQNHVDCLGTREHFHGIFQKDIKVVTSGNDWVDFIPYECNKGIALQLLLTKLGIHPADVIAFGDQQNDLEMLKLVGTSYAMETASSEVKAHATNVTDSVEKILKTLI